MFDFRCSTGIPYVQTSTSIPTGQDVNVTYGTGYFSGLECKDLVVRSELDH